MARLKMGHSCVVSGDRFWDRKEDLELFIERIDAGANQLLVAQRRMGKTSLLLETTRIIGDRYICIFVDLQQARNSADAIVELSLKTHPYKNLWEKTKGLFSNVIDTLTNSVEKIQVSELGVTLRAGLTGGNWSDKGDQLFEILAESEKPVVLMIDEVPIMVNYMLKGDDYKITPERRARADEFMSWLRKNSIRYQGRVRIVLSGSIEYLFKPKLVGKRVQMHTLLVFLSIIGGLKLFGILGIIYGPLVVTAFLTLTDIYESSYRQIVEPGAE